MIDPDKARIAYKANDSNVKIYLEADSSVNKNSREFDRVSVYFATKNGLRLVTKLKHRYLFFGYVWKLLSCPAQIRYVWKK